jgi:hypothetical protein
MIHAQLKRSAELRGPRVPRVPQTMRRLAECRSIQSGASAQIRGLVGNSRMVSAIRQACYSLTATEEELCG